MSDGRQKTFIVENVIHYDAPDEDKQMALKWAERQVGDKLFDLLWANKLPAVVDIDEKIETRQGQWMAIPNDRITIRVVVTPVQFRNIEMPSYIPDYNLYFHIHKNTIKSFIGKILGRPKWLRR